MRASDNINLTEYRGEKAELRNAKLLYILMSALLITDWAMPQYFGIHIGFDFTCTRILNILIVIYFLFNRKAGNHFIKSIFDVQLTPYFIAYMLVMIYTTVLRVNINTFFLNFLDILTFYMVYYGIRYVIGVRKAIDWTVKFAAGISIYGIIEYALKFSPMSKYLLTLPSVAISGFRSGQFRISGPCVHPIGYGMLLIFLIAIVCIDYEKDEMYLFKHPIVLILLLLNIFLTGSRGPLGIAVLEMLLIILFSKRKDKKKTFIILSAFLILAVIVEIAIYNTSVGQYIMMQITSVVDEVFGTSYSLKYGADLELLNMSSDYRDYLPKIFTVDWLNPLVGRGANASVGFEFDGTYVVSIDSFYVALYIRYAYPGLITFVAIQLMSCIYMIRTAIKHRSSLCIATAIAILSYSICLYWVDYLQTTKYMYIVLAIYCAYYSERFQTQDRCQKKNRKLKRM